MKKSLKGKVFWNSKLIDNQELIFDEGRIVDIRNTEEKSSTNDIIIPGGVELQVYGSGDYLYSSRPSLLYLQKAQELLLKQGTTSFLMCLATNSIQVIEQSIDVMLEHRHLLTNCLGLHLEGPYLNTKKRGAHIEHLIKKATLQEVQSLVERAQGLIKMLTIAPECNDPEIIDYLLAQGIIVSIGHSDATFQQATDAYNAGVQTTTHLFNAMSPLQHRAPGIPTAVMNHPSAMASIIPDGIHVDFEVIRLAQNQMGNRLFMITDAVANCSEGPYQHQSKDTHFVTTDGALSGSAISLLQGIKNCIQHCNISEEEAIAMATSIPASLLSNFDAGTIDIGKKANFMVLDSEWNLKQVYFEGNIVQ